MIFIKLTLAFQFVLGTLFAGIINSGLMSAWIFIFLDQEPQWKHKVVAELKSLLDKYAPVSRGYTSAAERFSDIPPEAWEGEMPVLEVSGCVSFFHYSICSIGNHRIACVKPFGTHESSF